jgi:hypothetical protein
MSTILVLCVVAAAVWVAVSLVGRSSSGPKDSVEDFSRALSALSPQAPARQAPARRASTRRAPARPADRRPAAGHRPVRPAPRPVGRR